MFWYGHGASGWGWFAMPVGIVLFWVLLITLDVLLYRSRAPRERGNRASSRHPGTSPEQLLAERFARGEIDEDEYRRRLTVLRGGGRDSPAPVGNEFCTRSDDSLCRVARTALSGTRCSGGRWVVQRPPRTSP
ncbi:SHOCT domain-containing protein [Streptomyces durhamensis]